MQGETVGIQTKMGRSIFRSNFSKAMKNSNWEEGRNEPDKNNEERFNAQSDGKESDYTDLKPGCQYYTTSAIDHAVRAGPFEKPQHAELKELLINVTFVVRKRSNVPAGVRVFGSSFVEEINKSQEGLLKKSKLCFSGRTRSTTLRRRKGL